MYSTLILLTVASALQWPSLPIVRLFRKLAISTSIGYNSLRNTLLPVVPHPAALSPNQIVQTKKYPLVSSNLISTYPSLGSNTVISKSAGSSFVRDAVRSVGPSVARIDCEKEISPLLAMFSENFKEGDSIKVSGSGIVVSSDGYLLTNAHVVDGSKRIIITLASGRSYKATLVSSDELTDLAVIKADVGGETLSKAPIGDSSALVSGDWVIAVGCPVGLDFTVTLGVVSNPKRSASEVGAPHMRGSFIQTDAGN